MAKTLLAFLLATFVVNGCAYFEAIEDTKTTLLCRDEKMDAAWRAKMCGDDAAVQSTKSPTH